MVAYVNRLTFRTNYVCIIMPILSHHVWEKIVSSIKVNNKLNVRRVYYRNYGNYCLVSIFQGRNFRQCPRFRVTQNEACKIWDPGGEINFGSLFLISWCFHFDYNLFEFSLVTLFCHCVIIPFSHIISIPWQKNVLCSFIKCFSNQRLLINLIVLRNTQPTDIFLIIILIMKTYILM